MVLRIPLNYNDSRGCLPCFQAQQIILVYIHKNDVGIYNVIKVPELLYGRFTVVEMRTLLMFKSFFARVFTTGLYL